MLIGSLMALAFPKLGIQWLLLFFLKCGYTQCGNSEEEKSSEKTVEDTKYWALEVIGRIQLGSCSNQCPSKEQKAYSNEIIRGELYKGTLEKGMDRMAEDYRHYADDFSQHQSCYLLPLHSKGLSLEEVHVRIWKENHAEQNLQQACQRKYIYIYIWVQFMLNNLLITFLKFKIN